MYSDPVISVENLSKCYEVYNKPHQRLLQMLFRGKRKYFNEFWALKNASFKVRAGETVGIIGSNGSGKSTLLQMLCGTLNPSGGEIHVRGRIAALLELGAGFNPEFTGKENVYLNAAILGLTLAEIEAAYADIEAFAEIGEFIDQPVKTYSSGMYVRLAFSVAVHTKPSILVVDEALSVGDARFQAKCLDRIKQMKESGVSILFVSHDVAAVRTLCDRALWLDKGTVRAIGEVFPVTAQYTEHLFDRKPEKAPDISSPEAKPQKREVLQPINQWGSHIGIIQSAGVYDAEGVQKNLYTDHEKMIIKIKFKTQSLNTIEGLSVSFSFKNLAGSDLIVGSTWNQKLSFTADNGNTQEVCFEVDNYLCSGDYLLVAAIENRSSAAIHYYEYVEGAQYFSSSFIGNASGQFMPRISMVISNDSVRTGTLTP
ncbi:ABC transporter ATP-binding protein [Pseudomonas rustica]|uniref:ABC transporter ATP-binding protein n=1 Tax=Pseudomonas rustica TaxID=2827099 RepID=A0ABS5MS43_9PSED|nr:ABC transporter ATP-binding protein [Pseudomonas rustica]MBS4076851.1 ABC transporter ATP-binding protein [Pseudomonas rustica]